MIHGSAISVLLINFNPVVGYLLCNYALKYLSQQCKFIITWTNLTVCVEELCIVDSYVVQNYKI